jgi:hypothetical protein
MISELLYEVRGAVEEHSEAGALCEVRRKRLVKGVVVEYAEKLKGGGYINYDELI